MKQHALAASIVAIFVAILILLNITPAHTNPVQAAPAAKSATPTFTPTATPTMTATNGACGGPPAAPLLKAPANNKVLPYNQTGVTLKWQPQDNCTTSYKVRIMAGSKRGNKLAGKKNLHKTKFVVSGLGAGQTYFWFVQACNAAGCTASDYNKLQVHAAPPRPTSVPKPTSTPASYQNPHVVGHNYGKSVYLNDIPDVYYFDCGGKWPSLGGLIYLVAEGFSPNEPVNLRGYEISSEVTSVTGYYIADDNGVVKTVVDSGQWPGGHFHLIFTGLNSHISYCGHFDDPKPKH